MRRMRINPISSKQREKLKLWDKITRERIDMLERIYGCPICEFCAEPAGTGLKELCGHHIIKRSRGGGYTPENCLILHYDCHQKLHDKGLDVRQLEFKGRK